MISRLRLPPEIIFQSDHLSRDLANKSIRGGISSMSAQAVQFLLSMIGTIILARLLTPTDYGLVGMVTVVTGFAAMFKNAGLSMATIQHEHITPAQISTLFWINLLISLLFGLGLIAIAPVISMFYREPELIGITIALAVSFIVSGVTIQHQALLYRHMRFGALAFVVIISQAISLGISLILAWLGWRYWALVGASLVGTLVATLLTFYFCPWVPEKYRRGAGVRGMLTFGGHLTVSNVANFVTSNMDNVLIGRFLGSELLGLYAKAYQLFLLPIRQVKDPLQNTVLPVLSSLRNQPERYRNYYRRFLDMLALCTIPIALYCCVEADFVVKIFLGPTWSGAIPVFRIFAVMALIYPLAGTQGLVLVSLGESRRFLRWGIITAGLSVISFIVGLPFGIVGVGAAFTVMNYLMLVPSLVYCFRGTPVTVGLFLEVAIVPILVGCLAAVGALVVKFATDDSSLLAHFGALALFAVIYGGLSYLRRSIRETVTLVLNSLLLPVRNRLG